MLINARKSLVALAIVTIAIVLVFHYTYRNRSTSLKKVEIPVYSDLNRIVNERKKSHNFVKGVLKFNLKTLDIFVHGRQDWVSKTILDTGTWEENWIDQMIKYLKDNPGIQLIDVGCNIGVYTMVAASLGHRVIAIDANKNNTDRLAQSLHVNGLSDKVTLMLNAVSNERKSFSLNYVPENIAAQTVKEITIDSYQVKGILLDDLMPFMSTDQTFIMKIDLEGHEIQAMQGASNLFTKANIKFVIIEWLILKYSPKSDEVVNFFLAHKYKPYHELFSSTPLETSNHKGWPPEVIWKRM